MYYLIGLGNEGGEYVGTHHNIGRDFVEHLAKTSKKIEVEDLKYNKTKLAHLAKFTWQDKKGQIVIPATFMNLSGKAVGAIIKPAKALPKVIVVHDDLDLPLGTVKLVFDRGSGGHKGVESAMRALKTKAFIRLRVGISAKTKKGIKKVSGEEEVKDFVLGKFKPSELEEVKKVYKKLEDGVLAILSLGYELAANGINQKN